MLPIQLLNRVEFAALRLRIQPLIAEIGDHLLRLDVGIAEGSALILRGQKSGAQKRSSASSSRT